MHKIIHYVSPLVVVAALHLNMEFILYIYLYSNGAVAAVNTALAKGSCQGLKVSCSRTPSTHGLTGTEEVASLLA